MQHLTMQHLIMTHLIMTRLIMTRLIMTRLIMTHHILPLLMKWSIMVIIMKTLMWPTKLINMEVIQISTTIMNHLIQNTLLIMILMASFTTPTLHQSMMSMSQLAITLIGSTTMEVQATIKNPMVIHIHMMHHITLAHN